MSNILKGIINEVNPHNYDSDWDYQDAVARSGKSRSSYPSQEDDTFDADVAYSRKMYQLGQQQKRDADHDRLATGTNEDDSNQTRMRMNDYYDLAEALQEKLRQAIKFGDNELVHKLSKERAELDARVKKYGLIPESQLDEISNEKLSQYKTAASADAGKADKEGDYKRGNKRFSGIVKATKKQFANDTKKSGISQGINEFSPGATGPKGPKDYGQPNSSRYIGGNKFVVGTTNNYVLTATIDKWGLEWDEDDEIWFLDSPGAAHIADASEGEIELPPPREQRNQIHDLVTDYLNARNSADLQKVAAYYGHSADGEMATNESSEAHRFNSKQEVINHFVKNGKSAAAGAAAWERGYRGSSPKKPIELKKPPQRSYHDDLDDKRYSTFENLGDQLKSTSLDALVKAKLAIEQQRQADIEAWRQDFEKNTVQKAQQGLRKEFQPTPVAQPGEKHSVLKARLVHLNNAIEKQALLDKLVDRLERKGLMTPAMQNDTDTSMHVKYGAKDNYQSLNKKLDSAISMLQDRLYIRKKSGLKEEPIDEEKQRLDPSCWKGYKKQGTKMKGDTRVNNCVPVKETKSHILAGLQQVDEGWKDKLGAAALAGSMALGAAGANADTRRVTPDGQGGFTGGMKPTATVQAEPAPATPSTTTIPGQGLVRAERADRQAGTVTVNGQEYKMIMLEPGGIRPRGGQQIVISQAVMGERGIGNYMAILAGGRVFVLPKND